MVIILRSCEAIRPPDENAQSETRLKNRIDCAWDGENMKKVVKGQGLIAPRRVKKI